jgi:leucyl aminopeptidase (aminopeptidase T)
MPPAFAQTDGVQQALARRLLDVCLNVKSGDRVWINSWDHTLDLASQLAWECRKRGCDILTTIQREDLWLRSIMEAPVKSLDRLPKHMAAALEKTDVYIYTLGPSRPVPWDKIPKERRKLVTRWFLEDNNFVKAWKTIAKRRRVRMLGIEATLATPETARVLGLNYGAWRRTMFAGCMADYHAIAERARRLAKMISGEGAVHITTPHGTDFRFRLDQRPVDVGYGLADDEMVREGRVVFVPAGGVEASADEESGEGIIVFDAPILSLVKGRIERLELRVKNGRIRHHSAGSNSPAFGRWLKEGGGDVDRFGFFGFGLNPRLKHGFTQDDKVLGGVTVGFGDNSDKAGKNRAYGRGFWASMTRAKVTIDNRIIMDNGNLLV